MSNDHKSGIISWFARNPVAANFLMIGIGIAGLLSAFSITKEFFPSDEADTISVRVPYLGAAPLEVEEGVCIKIEEVVQDLEGIKEMRSEAREGYGAVHLEAEVGYDISRLLDQVKNRVDSISTFPGETEKPIISESFFQRQTISVQLSGQIGEKNLKELAKTIRDEIIDLPSVTQAELVGVRNYEISVEVTEATLRSYGLTFDDVTRAVRNSSLDLPAGSIKSSGGEILLRTKGQAYRGHEFEGIVLKTFPDGTRLLLGDIAVVNDGFEEQDILSEFNGQSTVGINVYRVGSQSTLAITDEVKAYITDRVSTLPQGVNLKAWRDQSKGLRGRLDLMIRNALFGGALVFISLALFLRLRLAFWVILGLPICFLGAFWMMPFFGVTINMITLFAFILVLGIVVDDAIVIGENVYSTIDREGGGVDNVIKGAQEVAMPATFGVLTTIVAFIPMIMIPGNDGKVWGSIAIVVMLCLAFSLVESKLILPAHLSHIKIQHRSADKLWFFARFQRHINNLLDRFIEEYYKPLLRFALEWRAATLSVFIGVIILTVGLVASGLLSSFWFPRVPSDFAYANLTMAEGTPAHITQAHMKKMGEAILLADEEVKAEYGYGVVEDFSITASSDIRGGSFVQLVPSEDRDINAQDFVRIWRKNLGPIPGASELTLRGYIGGNRSPIQLQLEGDSFDSLDKVADALKSRLGEYAGVYDIKDSFSVGKKEIRLKIKPSAEALGLTLNNLARQVRQGFYGAEAQRIQRGEDEVKVMIRYPLNERASVGDLENMRIRTPEGDEVPFSAVAEIELGRGYSTITRVDGKRAVTVTADVNADGSVDTTAILAEIYEDFFPNILPGYPGVEAVMEGQSRDRADTIDSLIKGGVLAFVVILALLSIALKSYSQPLIIMSVIPFGVVGALWGHYLMGFKGFFTGVGWAPLPLSILSFSGIIAAAGVVVNDSLVLVDYVNKKRKEGMPIGDAVILAGGARFRAILLTSLTTFAGLTPMIIERSLQAQFLIPMAVSLAFGVLFATVVTLIWIPVLYVLGADLARGWKYLYGKQEAGVGVKSK